MSDSRQILIVEDEPNVRLVFRTALESNAQTLSTAEDGETALRWLKRSPADLVLLDLQMPGLSGMEVLRRLRDTGNGVPVVIITAHGSIPDAVQAMKLGAVDFLTKPVTPEALRRVVAEVLARHAPQPKAAPRKAPGDPAAEILAQAKRSLNLREFDQAEGLLLKAIELRPQCAEAHYLTGVLHELRGERHAAYSAYRKALQADPNYEPARLHLTKYYDDRVM
jgi:DNA-binding NtrC family response regulator